MVTPKGVWILLNWKVKKMKSLYWNEKFTIKTWPAKHNGPFSIRNYEVYNSEGELVTIASTKWVIMEPNTQKIVRDIEDVVIEYGEYPKMLFESDMPKLKEPQNIEYNYKHIVERRDIDTNNHVNNVKYLEIAYEALPKDVYDNDKFTNIDIMYKHSAFLNQEMVIGYDKITTMEETEQYTLVIKSSDKLNAIIRLS